MSLKVVYEIWKQIKDLFSSNKIFSLWRTVLCFFSTDYFIRFKFEWIEKIKNVNPRDFRTYELLYFISVYILVWITIYKVLDIPLRLLFHGHVKKKVLSVRQQMNQKSALEKKRYILEFMSRITPFFNKYLFRYGILSSNDLNDPIDYSYLSKEKEFNEVLSVLYRWKLTIIHTLLVTIIVWKFYAVWFFAIILLVFIVSMIMSFSFTFLILNLDYLEPVRLQLLKENKKRWN